MADKMATDILTRYAGRRREIQHMMTLLVPNPRLDGNAADVAHIYWVSAQSLVDILEDGPELTTGLRKLLESKDCLVRQALLDCGAL